MSILTRTFLLGLLMTAPALAADRPSRLPSPTPEMRENMAQMHDRMAACLRSSKPIQDCHKEMMDYCRKNKEACPMMMRRMGNKGMRGMRGMGGMGGPGTK